MDTELIPTAIGVGGSIITAVLAALTATTEPRTCSRPLGRFGLVRL
jgi:hypothetical protein